MTLEYTTNSWRHGYYSFLSDMDFDLTLEDIELLKTLGYNMVFLPCF